MNDQNDNSSDGLEASRLPGESCLQVPFDRLPITATVDVSFFIERECEELVSRLGVYNVWIARIMDDRLADIVSSFESSFAPFRAYTATGQIPYCVREVMGKKDLVVVDDPNLTCGDCPLAKRYNDRIGLILNIQHNDKMLGVLCASAPAHLKDDALLVDQFRHAARQIGQTLHVMEERIELQRQIQESRRQLASILDSLPGMAYRCNLDAAWTMEFVSNGCVELTGYQPDDLIRSKKIAYAQLIVPEDRTMVARAINEAVADGKPYTLEYRIRQAGGEERWVWEKGHAVRLDGTNAIWLEGFITDVTERRAIEARLLHMQKNESLAVMAGGMAHDFNNMLMTILGNAESALTEAGQSSTCRDQLQQIVETTGRAAQLCRQVLAFSGQSGVTREALEINTLIDALMPSIELFKPSGVTIKVDYGADLPCIHADASDIRYAILQLVKNALEACERQGGGVSITTSAEYFDGRTLKQQVTLDDPPAGWYVVVSVKDTGCGMDAATMGKLFEPFFSTKFPGRGMGLPAVAGIIRSLNGSILATSKAGQGSCFKLLLPVAEGCDEASSMGKKDGAASTQPRSIRTILVVDDEPSLRHLAKRMLERAGYKVVTGEHGLQAVEVFSRQADEIDAVIMDMTMPVMDGIEAIGRILSINPTARVILSTGYADIDISNRLDKSKLAGVLLKPYTQKDLLNVLSGISKPA